MTIHFIAQTTVPVVVVPSGGMGSWGVAEWTAFITILTTLIGVLTTSIISIVKSVKSDATSQAVNDKVASLEATVDTRITNTNRAIETAQATAAAAQSTAATAMLHATPPVTKGQ